ncbi:MAG: hypothetical protein QOC78_1019 [Solirubrobacteraceae bacterium]|nr:hypothetical protein [Solirubrobacteraceae bacterium]
MSCPSLTGGSTGVRERRGSVHSVVVVPVGRRSYVLTTVSQAGRKDVAREIGGIVTSFGL